MVHKWRCRHCGFSAWSDSYERLSEAIGSHLFDHHSGRVRKADFRLKWDCPYCSANGKTHDEEAVAEAFKQHLSGHATKAINKNTHMAEEIGRSGNVLVKAPMESAAADNARVHFLSGSDLAIVVTKKPKERIRLLHQRLDQWPERTIVMTTKRRSLDEGFGIDLSSVSVELVELDRRLGPSELGETISRVIDVHYTSGDTLSVEFDILSDIITSFDLRTSYDFVSMLSNRLREVGAIAHIYVASQPKLSSALNVLEGKIDLELSAESKVFTSQA
jgi:hypothetical protein